MLYVIGMEFTGFEPEALWDDSVFGFKHWHNFVRIAVVADTHGCAQRSVCSSRSFMQKSGRSAYQKLQL